MANEYTRYRIFWAFQDDKEEQWLAKMSQKGYHIKDYTWFKYTFEVGCPHDYVYLLDYKGSMADGLEEYIELYKQSGFEYICEFNGWCYFKGKQNVQVAELKRGNISKKVATYQYLSRLALVGGLFNLIIYVINMFQVINHTVSSSLAYVGQINLICGLFVIWVSFVLNKKANFLKLENPSIMPITSPRQKVVEWTVGILITMYILGGIIHIVGALIH